jgi:hypothetical protein
VREGRENRKKSTAPVLAAEQRSDEALRNVKKGPFWTYAVKPRKKRRRRAAQQVREKFQQVPDLFQGVRDLLHRAVAPVLVAPFLNFFNDRRGFRGVVSPNFF